MLKQLYCEEEKNSQTQVWTKLNYSNCDKSQELKMGQNSATQIVTKLKTQLMTKLKNSNYDTINLKQSVLVRTI